jgi:hypothetical protein
MFPRGIGIRFFFHQFRDAAQERKPSGQRAPAGSI